MKIENLEKAKAAVARLRHLESGVKNIEKSILKEETFSVAITAVKGTTPDICLVLLGNDPIISAIIQTFLKEASIEIELLKKEIEEM